MPDFRTLVARFKSDLSGIDKGFQDANAKIDKFSKETESKYGALAAKIRSTGLGLSAAITAPIVLVGKSAIDATMEAIETQNKFEVAFKDGANQAQQWADKFSASVGGLDITRLQEYSAQFQLLFNAMDMSEKGQKMSTTLAQLSYDLSSLHNTSIEEAFTRLQSGIVGETEAIRRYGVDISDASLQQYALSKGIQESTANMSQAEKVQLRYEMIMRQTKDAQGDLIRTSDSAANQSRLLQEEWMAEKRKLGEDLIPTYLKMVSTARNLIKTLDDMSPAGRKAVVEIAAVAAAIGPALIAVSVLPSTVAGLKLMVGPIATGAKTIGALTTAARVGGIPAMLELSAAAIGVQGAFVLAAAAIGVLIWRMNSVKKHVEELQNKAQAIPKNIQEANKDHQSKAFSGMSDSQLENYRKAQMDNIRNANERLKEADGRAKWWKPGGWGTAYRDVVEERNEVKRIQGVLDSIDAEKKRRKSSTASSSPASAISEEGKKAIADLEKANTDAKRQVWILSQANEAERKKAEAWVEYKKSEEEIYAKQAEVKNKSGQVVDISDQIAAAKAAYTDKLKDIQAEEQKQADATTSRVQAAKLQISAVQASNDYERQILEEQASLVNTLQSLRSQDASIEEIELARAQSAKRIADIKQQQADEWQKAALNDAASAARAKAISSGNKKAVSDINAAEAFLNSIREANELSKKGLPTQGMVAEANARLYDDLAKNANVDAEKKAQEAREKQAQALAERTAQLESQAINADMSGDTVGAAHARAMIDQMNTAAQLNELKEKGIDITQRANLANAKYLKAIRDAQDQVVKAEAEAVQAKIEEIRREDEERQAAYERELERRKNLVGFTDLEEYGRQAMISGLTTRFQPYAPSRDTSYPATNDEIQRAYDQMLKEQVETNRRMQKLITAVENLGGKTRRI